MDTNFSDWLVEMMKDRQWTQADFSRATGLTRQAISYYLSGKSKQPDEFKIAKALNLPPEEVYRAAGIPLSPPAPDETLYRIEHLYHPLKDLPKYIRTNDPKKVNLQLHRLFRTVTISPDFTITPHLHE